jgi:GTP-binding protein Era
MTRCGIVAVVGPPNAGKSTLLNRLVGQHLAIVSPKPQSTRQRVVGIVTRDQEQLIFADTPGLLDPKYHLQRSMQHDAMEALRGADLVLLVIDASLPDPVVPDILGAAARADARGDSGHASHRTATTISPAPDRLPARTILALNKADLVPPETIDALLARFPGAVPISATTGHGVDALLDRLAASLPEGPFLHDPEDASSQSVRFFVTEAIREVAFEQLEDELPYAVHCEIDEFREQQKPVYIRATLYVERESQKRIVIGEGGKRIREIGRAARDRVEQLVGASVYLDLWVKVLPNWRRNLATLRRLGFTLPKE